jgi:hypothetical protein
MKDKLRAEFIEVAEASRRYTLAAAEAAYATRLQMAESAPNEAKAKADADSAHDEAIARADREYEAQIKTLDDKRPLA